MFLFNSFENTPCIPIIFFEGNSFSASFTDTGSTLAISLSFPIMSDTDFRFFIPAIYIIFLFLVFLSSIISNALYDASLKSFT